MFVYLIASNVMHTRGCFENLDLAIASAKLTYPGKAEFRIEQVDVNTTIVFVSVLGRKRDCLKITRTRVQSKAFRLV